MSKNCFVWTRVSTKYQEENGGSLDDQKCKCEMYAKEHDFQINGYYGGTHESAKTPGKLVKEMLSALKRNKTVKYILVKNADKLKLIEIKSSETYHQEFEKGIKAFCKEFGDKVEDTTIIYAGDLENTTREIKMLNYSRLYEIL